MTDTKTTPISADEYLRKILLAPVYDVARNTDLDFMPKLAERLHHDIWLKREDQQPVKSFKLRGAYNKLASLSQEQRDLGVIAASAGNHAQGLAMSANKMQVKATIVMPETTPDIKVNAVRRFGGYWVNVVLHGKNFDAASAEASRLSAHHGLTMVHPFDDPDVIAGQGTIGKELFDAKRDIDTIFIAVGGGGLVAGIGAYIKQLNPDVRIVAVEAEESACLKAAFEKGEQTTLDKVGIFADGVAVRRIGAETLRLCQQYVDEVITVSSDEICAAIKDIFDDTRAIAEPAGAISVAGIKKWLADNPQTERQQLAGILCGANINFHTLRYVSERCELGEGREAIIAATIPEQKGAFREFCAALGDRTITEFNYRYCPKGEASVYAGVRLRRGEDELQEVFSSLTDEGINWFDLTDNEVAKQHVRYMVGGRVDDLPNERLYSFVLPALPGALDSFLNTLGGLWNITLFHYRNHDAADAMVLAGFDIKDDEKAEFEKHLQTVGYKFEEETDNPAYRFFLKS
ncbi:threonine ammonia-lyase, biosynthetic [Catenovulum sp. SM1970]|uniref:threonine ammonia-lyase, biosynthetic n=1 Tax=Marinifaba aquimaris TaxID=2741323 RepID=UPI001571A18F|nr:threonine ammonia-lyase, biosynthetic [Marinifaba aquimaris]NTS75851.1 threonine ammonia-lyase, biosynthetic [Marinifaba aquimaris]